MIGGGILFLKFQTVTIATLSGQVAYTGAVSDLTAQQVGFYHELQLKVKNVSRLDYMLMSRGKPRIVSSQEKELPSVVNLTITFKLITPTNTVLIFEPLKLGKGGVHNFTMIIGPDEGLSETGIFMLEITFHLVVTRPDGMVIVEVHRTIEITFTVPKGTVSMRERGWI